MLVQLLEQDRFHIRVAVRSQESFEKLTSYKPLSPYVSLLESVIVPDISVPGAYDEVVKGVTHIVHVASPIPGSNTKDGDLDIIEPAIRGTVGILESAHKTTGVVKVVITASLASIASTEYIQSGGTVNGMYTTAVVLAGDFSNSRQTFRRDTCFPPEGPLWSRHCLRVLGLQGAVVRGH